MPSAAGGKRMVTTAFEHSSILEPMKRLGEEGFEPVFVKPDEHGIISAEDFLSQVTPDTILVSFMLVNNEVGTMLPYEEIAEEVRRIAPNATIHCDAVQAYGKLPLKVEKLPIDLGVHERTQDPCAQGHRRPLCEEGHPH